MQQSVQTDTVREDRRDFHARMKCGALLSVFWKHRNQKRSLDRNEATKHMAARKSCGKAADIIGESRFRMASTGQPLPYRRKKPPLLKKALSCRRKRLLDDGKRPAQVPEEKLDETFTSIPPEELGYGDDEPEEDASDTPRASGSSFDEIDDACKTAKTRTRHRRNVKRRRRCSPTWRARSCTRK